jgi:hypothetical protein
MVVAERIAYERKEEIGQSVGYQIPLETKLLFLFSLLPFEQSLCIIRQVDFHVRVTENQRRQL